MKKTTSLRLEAASNSSSSSTTCSEVNTMERDDQNSFLQLSNVKNNNDNGCYNNESSKERKRKHTCPICNLEYNDYSLFLNHLYGDSLCSEEYQIIEDFESKLDKKNTKSIVQYKYDTHYRKGSYGIEKIFIKDISIIVSKLDQFSFGGKSACTTIACEACITMLSALSVDNISNVNKWNESFINKIVENGCKQDPKLGNLSFREVYNRNYRFSLRLEILDEIQAKIDTNENDNAFYGCMQRMRHYSKFIKDSVCAVITKQPETIMIYYNFKTNVFILFDSHPRTTDDVSHGASCIFLNSFDSLNTLLKEWLFPVLSFGEEEENKGYEEMYNTVSCTIVKLKRDAPSYIDLEEEASYDRFTRNKGTSSALPKDASIEEINLEEVKELTQNLNKKNSELKGIIETNNNEINRLKNLLLEAQARIVKQEEVLQQGKALQNALNSIQQSLQSISHILK
ncbi:hypothetical protein ABK040_002008 [Willaertia magna]